ncbi:MAG: HPr(Ser) kinase/phosphatase [Clostridiales bacterium]|jgi:HPr kinase/phosphorylase|nr:HPr(Ser) kinase/phosphatase [Clostridiales bacterium]
MYTVSLSSLIQEFDLKILSEGVEIADKVISHAEINRPALQLAGYYDYFDSDRLQIIGIVEYTYLQRMDSGLRKETIHRMFANKIPCLVICRSMEPFPEMIPLAEEYDVPVLGCQDSTTDFMGEVIRWLKVHLAPRITMHGVLVDIYGEGVFIMGESGIGKSETALELIKRGHRFVADDAVEIKRVSHQTLIGSCPELIKYFIELRGIGIIDVRQMFGVESLKATQSIDLIIKLEQWDQNKTYDRLGLHEEYMEILGNKLVCHSIPIRPSRNLAIICESAAINHRQKKMGYNAAQALQARVSHNMNVQ